MKDFLELAASRYSVRKFQENPVEQEKIDKILEASKLAPTACNNQPQKIFVVTDEKLRNALAELTPCTFHAPVIFVIGYDSRLSAKGMIHDSYDFGDTDSAIVCTHMMLEVSDLGLGSCCVGYFHEEQVRSALNIPPEIRIRELLPVGYPSEDSTPAPLHRKSRETDEMVCYL